MPKVEENLTENLMISNVEKKNNIKYNCALFFSLTFIYGFGFVSGYLYHGYSLSDGSTS